MRKYIFVFVAASFLGVLASTLDTAIIQTEVDCLEAQEHETIPLQQMRPKRPAPRLIIRPPPRADLELGAERHSRELIRVKKIQIGVLATLVGIIGLSVVAYTASCFPRRRRCYIIL